MKYLSIFLFFVISITIQAQQYKLTKLWETDKVINVPESIVIDEEQGFLFVSIIGNNQNEKDGIGGVGKIGLDGKIIDTSWVTGLNAPKGLGRFKNTLYAADLTDVVVIDIVNAKVKQIIPIDSSVFLNDITVDDMGIVYVSDSRTGKIHRIENGMPSLYLENIKGVNGLKAIGTDLYIAGGKTIWKADAKRNLTKVIDLPNNIDGVEPVGNGDFVYSSWSGFIYYGKSDGTHELLLDTSVEKKNTADIDFDPVNRIIYVPTFWNKTVAAYKLD